MPTSDARSLSPDALEFIRSQALRLREEGYTLAEVAKVCGVAQGTVTRWTRRANSHLSGLMGWPSMFLENVSAIDQLIWRQPPKRSLQ